MRTKGVAERNRSYGNEKDVGCFTEMKTKKILDLDNLPKRRDSQLKKSNQWERLKNDPVKYARRMAKTE
jgi:hypothetical protein